MCISEKERESLKGSYGLEEPVRLAVGRGPRPQICHAAKDLPQSLGRISVVPHKGIGPLELGMTEEQILGGVQALLGHLGEHLQIQRDPDGCTLRYMAEDILFLVQYTDGKAVEIAVDHELGEHTEVTLYDRELFKIPAEELIRTLRTEGPCSCDAEDEDLGTEYIFEGLGLRLWREDAFHPKLLEDPAYMEKMSAVLEEQYPYRYFQIAGVRT